MMIGLTIYIDRIMIMMIALGDVHMTTNMVGAVQIHDAMADDGSSDGNAE